MYVRRVLAELRWECDPDVFANIFGDIFTPNRPVCDLIPKLAANYRLVLASNSNGLHAADFLPAFAGTLGHFQKLVFSYEVTARKPDAAFYRACQEHACCEPRQCLFVDDRTDNIEAAARHGWNVIHLTSIDKLLRGLARFGVYNDF